MATRTIECRVCGKQFVPCNKSSASLCAFNYRSIACSPECGVEYLRRVQEARKQPEQKATAELVGQLEIAETAAVNIDGENSDDTVKAVELPKATYHSRKNKQETNEKE